MKLDVVNTGTEDGPISLEVDSSTDIGTLKSLVEVELGIPFLRQILTIPGKTTAPSDNETVGSLGLKDHDVIAVQDKAMRGADHQVDEQARTLMNQANSDRGIIDRIRVNNPVLAEAIETKDIRGVARELRNALKSYRRGGTTDNRALAAMRDPLSPEAQAYMMEKIKQENIDHNLATAHEFMPESFGEVVMLYIKIEVNGVPVMAFVDSGAQATIMSEECARRCGLDRIIDTRYGGMATGVGAARVTGRIHMAQIKCGDVFIPASFSILENQSLDVLIGLDLLKRHQCCIDLKNNCLRIGTTNNTVGFLSEAEIRNGVNDAFLKNVTAGGTPQSHDSPATLPRPLPPQSKPPSTQQPNLRPGGTTPHRAVDNHLGSRSPPTGPTRPQSGTTQAPDPIQQAAAQLHRSGRVHTGTVDDTTTNVGAKVIEQQKLKQLVDLGFNQAKALEALRKYKGDLELAAAALFQSTGSP